MATPKRTRLWTAMVALAVCAHPVHAAETGIAVLRWDFEDGTQDWQPRVSTITNTHVTAPGAAIRSRASLRVQGRIEGNWNYTVTPRFPMRAGQLYRLSAWVCVTKLGPQTPAPYLKCEFVGPPEKPDLGQVTSSRYDLAGMGTWQRLETEFRAPQTIQQGWLALEKGTSGPAEIDAFLDDILIEPIPRLTALDKYHLRPLPPRLAMMRGIHPRVYVDASRVTELRTAIQSTHAGLWQEVRKQADRLARREPPTYREHDSYSGDEQLWQRDVGNAMPVLAMAWILSEDRAYLEAARKWALASCGYRTWGLNRIDGMDLAAGHQLLGLGIVYDWCYDDLADEARRIIRETLIRRTAAMYEAAATGKVWWHRSYLQNHLWVNICGMAVAGLALYDEVADASAWIGLPLDKFRKTMAALGHDGASHEGVGYWEYGVEYLLKFMDLARTRLDADLDDHDWWRNTARYAQYLALPRRAWTRGNCVVDIADCPRGHWYGPDYLLRGLARMFRDGHAQWLAREINEAGVQTAEASWLNLVWYDATVPVKPPGRLPTLRHFDDLGIVSARSDWSGDESLVVFKCGPFIGHQAVQQFAYDPGGGHVHPDANHFVLFGAGEWLVRDDGYRAKWTGQHNSLLVDGKGQIGEGKLWFDGIELLRLKARPRILRAESSAAFDLITGDATEAYAPEVGLRRHLRHLLFLKPDALVVCDEVLTDKPRELELRFHPESPGVGQEGGAFHFGGRKAVMRLEPLTPKNVLISAGDVAVAGRHGELGEKRFAVRLNTRAARWRNAVALSWCNTGLEPQKVSFEARGHAWTFHVGDRTATLDWSDSPGK